MPKLIKTIKKIVGDLGENIACEYLIKNNYSILKRNHRERSDEIDVIARSPERILVFCEVKTLKVNLINSSRNLIPEDNLTWHKLKKMTRACQIFAGKHPEFLYKEKGWRMDLIAISINRGGEVIGMNHYENI